MCVSICIVSSRVGARTNNWGRSPWCSCQYCKAGRRKAAVLPLPVWAQPMRSRPASTTRIARGLQNSDGPRVLRVQGIEPPRRVEAGRFVTLELLLPMLLAQLLIVRQGLRIILGAEDDLAGAQHVVGAVGGYSGRIGLQGKIRAVDPASERARANANGCGRLRSRHGNSFP